MYLSRLEVTQVRNLHSLQIDPHPSLNFIVGDNGSGKTSLLESISLLSRGRSFRSPYVKKVITQGKAELTVFGEVHGRSLSADRLGICKRTSGETLAKINSERCDRLSDLALLLPVVEIEASSFELIDGGPSVRRELLDWGLFHVEHRFLDIWKRYRVALDQRNALLKAGDSSNLRYSLPHWNSQLAEYGHALDDLRQHYVGKFSSTLSEVTAKYLGIDDISVVYQSGWNQAHYSSLLGCLEANRESDIEKGRSQYGPHRADLDIRWGGSPARDICSRGQKKLVLYAVRLAQIMLYQREKQSTPILLLDDLPAELDKQNIEKISRFLRDYPCQSFITAIAKDIHDSDLVATFGTHRMFHVEHGQLIHSN